MKRGQAILAQAVLLAPVVTSIFNLWAVTNPMTSEQRARVVQVLQDSFGSFPIHRMSVISTAACLPIRAMRAITYETEP